MKTDRRTILKACLAGLAAGGYELLMPGEALSKIINPAIPGTFEGSKNAGKRLAMVIDTRHFTETSLISDITNACHMNHNVPTSLMEKGSKQDVKWIWSSSYEQAFPDDTNIYVPDKVRFGSFPILCNHCDNPPCVRVCPTGATFKGADGAVIMDPHRCIGCRFCMAGCPYGARSFNFQDPIPLLKLPNPSYPARMRGVVEKCTFCPERTSLGKQPYCVEASRGTILFGDLNDQSSSVRKALASNMTIRRKPTLGTGPGVYYIIEGGK